MSINLVTKLILSQNVTTVNVPKGLTCAESMAIAAKKAESRGLIIVQFEHEQPPRFSGPGGTSKKVTLIDTSKISTPKAIIHVSKSEIGVNGYAKLVPNYRDVLQNIATD